MWGGGHRVLDIGCGIGRWGEYLLNAGYYYVGIDGSTNLIKRAQENLSSFTHKKLLTGYFQNLKEILASANETYFDYVFVNGVFMYLNDADYAKALADILDVCEKHAVIYSKESVARQERLTLDNIHSEELRQDYSAIYRSIQDYRESQKEAWSASFRLIHEGYLFSEELQNRKETVNYYFIWER